MDRRNPKKFKLHIWVIFFIAVVALVHIFQAFQVVPARPNVIEVLKSPEEVAMLEVASKSNLIDQEVVYAVLRLPLEYSHIKRHKNIENMKTSLPNLLVVEGFHGNSIESQNQLIAAAKIHSLYIDKNYYDKSGDPVHFGKLGLYASFLRIFNDIYSYKNGIVTGEKNLFSDFNPDKIKCLVIIEDDLVVHSTANEAVIPKCATLLHEKAKFRQETIFYRLSHHNAFNVYNVDKLPIIIDEIRENGVTNPFDIFTNSRRWFKAKANMKSHFEELKVKSSLITQKRVDIDSWNACLDSITEKTALEVLQITDSIKPLCTLDIHEN